MFTKCFIFIKIGESRRKYYTKESVNEASKADLHAKLDDAEYALSKKQNKLPMASAQEVKNIFQKITGFSRIQKKS